MVDEIGRRLDSADVEVRREAVLSLKGRTAGADTGASVGLLVKAMKDSSWRVRKTALDILIEDYPIEAYISEIIGLLYLEDNAGARNSAIEALTRLHKKATPYLIEAFGTENDDVRKFIIDVIGMFRDKRALSLMLKALNDEDPNVSASAVEHLGTIGDPSVVDALVGILEEGDLWTAFPAADALGRIGDRKALPALAGALSKKTLREPAIKAIARLAGKEDIRYIVPFLEDPSKVVREEAIKAMETLYHRGVEEDALIAELRERFGEKAVDMLAEHTKSSKPEVRVSAILMMGLLKDRRALDPLLELSQEEGFIDDVKRALVFIGKGDPESLIPLFGKEDPYLRRFVCGVVSEVASPKYYDIMLGLLEDADGHVRSFAALTLANIGDSRAVDEILKLFSDMYEDVQDAAVEALSKWGGTLDTKMLVKGLSSGSPSVRRNVALLMGRIRAKEAVSALNFALKDESVFVRKAVVEAFSQIRTADSIKYIVLALTDEDPDVRALAALSLGAIGEKETLEPLSLLLNDKDDSIKVVAAKALGLLGDARAVPVLRRVLEDPNGFVVTTAMESLGALGGEEAQEALIRMLSSKDIEIRRTALKSLSRFEGVEPLIVPFVKDEDWATRMAAVEALAPSPKGGVREELERRLDVEEDPAVRRAIESLINA